jgi:histidine kinase
MDQLIDDLFLFSKLDLNRLPFEMSSVAVNDFMNEIVSEMQLGWEDEHRKLVLHNNLKSEEYVTIDAQKMRRVLINIIQNAMKYMDKEEELIDIHLTQDDNYIQIVVSDNGQGIDEEHVDHIFERFYRVDESRNNKTGGTGLGLAISKQIVEQHQGHIKATSELSKGTKIIVELKKMRTVDE